MEAARLRLSRLDEAAMRILLVEDDKKAARVLKKGLEEEGFVVDTASSGDKGEYLASITEYDLIVLDWLLPGKEGIQVCRELRGRGQSVSILMLTAKDVVGDRIVGLNTGVN
jgi:DNA-binding response OmpR family regulator